MGARTEHAAQDQQIAIAPRRGWMMCYAVSSHLQSTCIQRHSIKNMQIKNVRIFFLSYCCIIWTSAKRNQNTRIAFATCSVSHSFLSHRVFFFCAFALLVICVLFFCEMYSAIRNRKPSTENRIDSFIVRPKHIHLLFSLFPFNTYFSRGGHHHRHQPHHHQQCQHKHFFSRFPILYIYIDCDCCARLALLLCALCANVFGAVFPVRFSTIMRVLFRFCDDDCFPFCRNPNRNEKETRIRCN